MKPLQAAVSYEASGDDLTDDDLAIMCGSHNGEPEHLAAVDAVLDRAGLTEIDLLCPAAWPLDVDAAATGDGVKRRISHNCSGKHAGKLLACARRGWDKSSYLLPDHPLQERITAAVCSIIGVTRVELGTDGCGAPVHGLTLEGMAVLYARLVTGERLGSLADAVQGCFAAMSARPYLVGGRKREDTAIMQASRDVVVKAGAEGLLCAAVRSLGLGVAVKVSDGAVRAAGPVLIEALVQIGALGREETARLAPFARPPLLGGSEPVGEICPDFSLERPQS